MKLIIAGGRDFTDSITMRNQLNKMVNTGVLPRDLVIVSGMARGADKTGYVLAKNNNIPVLEFPADWDRFGKSAGYRRNTEMANISDYLLAFWDGKSRGTKHMIDIMRKQNKPVTVINY